MSEWLFLSISLSCWHASTLSFFFKNYFFFLSFPPSPNSPHSFRSDIQRPHLSTGQGKCLSHLLQETWSPLEMWGWSWGCAPGTGRLWTRTERETENAEQCVCVCVCVCVSGLAGGELLDVTVCVCESTFTNETEWSFFLYLNVKVLKSTDTSLKREKKEFRRGKRGKKKIWTYKFLFYYCATASANNFFLEVLTGFSTKTLKCQITQICKNTYLNSKV